MDYSLGNYRDEIERRRLLGISTLRWYKCHGCGAEYSISGGVRCSWGCSCPHPDIHIHSDLDGELPLRPNL